MAFTQAQLDALEDAIAQGSLRVSWTAAGSTKEVTYRTMEEMLRVRDMIRRSLGLTPACASRIYPKTSKGLW